MRTAALAGLLEAVTDQRVNAVNADLVARERGLTVTETRRADPEPWASLVTLDVAGGPGAQDALRLAGSTADGRPHLASLNGFELDAELAGTVLLTRHHDRPAVVGAVCTLLADALDPLEADQEFLYRGDVFTSDVVETWLDLKRAGAKGGHAAAAPLRVL
jgi:hypothetical protein